MALSASKLKNEILAIINDPLNFPASENEAKQRLADAYDNYAQDAVDGSGDGPLSVNKSGFQSALNFPVGGSAAAAATAFETAVVTYWTGATFNITTPPIGSLSKVSSTIITPPIPNGLIGVVFADISAGVTADEKAQQVADAIHTMTITGAGIINHIIPGGFPGPPIPYTIS